VILCFVGLLVFLPELSFTLSRESRLPRWFTLPPGLSRSDVRVTMDYYVLTGRTATFKLVDGKSRNTIGRVSGKLKGSDPITLAHTSTGAREGYPAYEIITMRGITEIIEHRQMEPIFYIADDPRVEPLGGRAKLARLTRRFELGPNATGRIGCHRPCPRDNVRSIQTS